MRKQTNRRVIVNPGGCRAWAAALLADSAKGVAKAVLIRYLAALLAGWLPGQRGKGPAAEAVPVPHVPIQWVFTIAAPPPRRPRTRSARAARRCRSPFFG